MKLLLKQAPDLPISGKFKCTCGENLKPCLGIHRGAYNAPHWRCTQCGSIYLMDIVRELAFYKPVPLSKDVQYEDRLTVILKEAE